MPAYVLYRAQELGWGVRIKYIYIFIYEVVCLMYMYIHFLTHI